MTTKKNLNLSLISERNYLNSISKKLQVGLNLLLMKKRFLYIFSIALVSVGFCVFHREKVNLYTMPKEYKAIKAVVDKLAASNYLGERPITFQINSGSYLNWMAEDIKLCTDDDCRAFEDIDPFREYQGEYSEYINQFLRSSYIYGGLNAFAYPSRLVSISRSAMRLLETDRKTLSFILAHEIGHIIEHHSFKTSEEKSIKTKNIQAEINAENDEDLKAKKEKEKENIEFAIDRKYEYIADRIASILLTKSNFGDNAAIEALQASSFITGDGEITQKDSTHPSWKDRIESLKKIDNKIDNQSYYQMNPIKWDWEYSRKYNYLQFNPKMKNY